MYHLQKTCYSNVFKQSIQILEISENHDIARLYRQITREKNTLNQLEYVQSVSINKIDLI